MIKIIIAYFRRYNIVFRISIAFAGDDSSENDKCETPQPWGPLSDKSLLFIE